MISTICSARNSARHTKGSTAPTACSQTSEQFGTCRYSSRISAALPVLLWLSLLGGCGLLSGKKEQPAAEPQLPLSQQAYVLPIRLVADPDNNPDPTGRASPIRVLVFLVEADSNLANSEFNDVFGANATEPLPKAVEMLHPGSERSLKLDAMKNESLLVVAAAYRDPWQVAWINELDVDVNSPNPVLVSFDNIGVRLWR